MQTGKILNHLIFRYNNNLFELYTAILALEVEILFANDACELYAQMAMLRAQNNHLSL